METLFTILAIVTLQAIPFTVAFLILGNRSPKAAPPPPPPDPQAVVASDAFKAAVLELMREEMTRQYRASRWQPTPTPWS